jgi:hypothetical protein
VETDGIQLKALLMTSLNAHPGPSGFSQLAKSGYQLSARPRVHLRDLLRAGRGVYNVKAAACSPQEMSDVDVTAIDPGQVNIMKYATAPASAWTRSNAASLMSEGRAVTGSDYARDTLATHINELEKKRKGRPSYRTSYGAALDTLPRRKTHHRVQFLEFCTARAAAEEAVSAELMDTTHRSFYRFRRFSATQRTLAKIAEEIAPSGDIKRARVVAFGNGSFAPRKGAAAAPRKKLVREFACRAVTLITPEAYTSMTCPGCLRKTRKGVDYRTRRCETDAGSRPCLLHPSTPSIVFDRDDAGYTNIGIRAVEMITGVFNGVYKPVTS